MSVNSVCSECRMQFKKYERQKLREKREKNVANNDNNKPQHKCLMKFIKLEVSDSDQDNCTEEQLVNPAARHRDSMGFKFYYNLFTIRYPTLACESAKNYALTRYSRMTESQRSFYRQRAMSLKCKKRSSKKLCPVPKKRKTCKKPRKPCKPKKKAACKPKKKACPAKRKRKPATKCKAKPKKRACRRPKPKCKPSCAKPKRKPTCAKPKCSSLTLAPQKCPVASKETKSKAK